MRVLPRSETSKNSINKIPRKRAFEVLNDLTLRLISFIFVDYD